MNWSNTICNQLDTLLGYQNGPSEDVISLAKAFAFVLGDMTEPAPIVCVGVFQDVSFMWTGSHAGFLGWHLELIIDHDCKMHYEYLVLDEPCDPVSHDYGKLTIAGDTEEDQKFMNLLKEVGLCPSSSTSPLTGSQ